jgi:hypothetical protein
MGCVAAGTKTFGRDLFDGASGRRDSVRQDLEKEKDGADGALAALGS